MLTFLINKLKRISNKQCCNNPDIEEACNRWRLDDLELEDYIIEKDCWVNGLCDFNYFIYKNNQCGEIIDDWYWGDSVKKSACLNCGTCFGKKKLSDRTLHKIQDRIKTKERKKLAQVICEDK
jgi:hypothetical protein